jgi:DNA-binding transcriptional LysR family regulator
MNLKKLEVFYLAAKHSSCVRAADELLVTQPAVSMQIRNLERFYQVDLFTRSGNRLQLTNAGKVLYAYAESIFKLATEAEHHLVDLGNRRTEILRIGTIPTYGKYVLANILSAFQKKNPQVKVIVKEGNSFQMTESVARNENEMAIVGDTGHWKRLSSIPFRKDELFLVVAKEHRWFTRRSPIGIEELKKERIVFREEGSAARYSICNMLKKHDFQPKIFLEVGSSDFAKEIVKGGKGVSFFTLLSIKDEIESGTFRPLRISSTNAFLDVQIFFAGKRLLSRPAKDFLKITEKQFDR